MYKKITKNPIKEKSILVKSGIFLSHFAKTFIFCFIHHTNESWQKIFYIIIYTGFWLMFEKNRIYRGQCRKKHLSIVLTRTIK